jgi:hypothetical protein
VSIERFSAVVISAKMIDTSPAILACELARSSDILVEIHGAEQYLCMPLRIPIPVVLQFLNKLDAWWTRWRPELDDSQATGRVIRAPATFSEEFCELCVRHSLPDKARALKSFP